MGQPQVNIGGPTNSSADEAEQGRQSRGIYVVLGGLITIGVLYLATLLVFTFAFSRTGEGAASMSNVANNMVAALGAVTGAISGLVGAYFGIQLGASGKDKSDAVAEKSNALAQAAMGRLDSTQAPDVITDANQILTVGTDAGSG